MTLNSQPHNSGLIERLVKRPRPILVGMLLLIVGLATQVTRFEIDASADTLLMRNNSNYIATQVANQRFAPQEFLLIGYRPRDGELFSTATYEDLAALTGQLLQLERVEAVRSILNVPLLSQAQSLTADLDPADWTLESLDLDNAALAEILADHPIYEDLLVDVAQTSTALQVLFLANPELASLQERIVELQQQSLQGSLDREQAGELSGLREQARVLQDELNVTRRQEIATVRDLLVPLEQRAETYLGGVHVLGFQLVQIIRSDLVVFGSAITFVIGLILLAVFRDWRWVIVTLLTCAAGVIATLGLFGMLGLRATVISANFVAIQLILTLAIVIHLIVQYREHQSVHDDWSTQDLLSATLADKIKPCLYAGLTTSVGFASLLFSNIQPVISFGWMMTIAVFVTILLSLVLFPTLLLTMPGSPALPGGNSPVRAVLGWFSTLAVRRPAAIAIAGVALLAGSVVGILRLSVENSFIDYFRESTQVHQELLFIDQNLGGSTPLDVIIDIPDQQRNEELVLEAETVQLLQGIQAAISAPEAMGKVLSVVNFTELAREINGGQPLTEYELTVIYRLLDEELREDLIGSFFEPQAGQLRISTRVRDATPGLDRRAFLEEMQTSIVAAGLPAERFQLTNLFVLYQDILQRLYRSQVVSLGLVYLALTIAFLLVFRSLRLALVGIAPNILATLLVLGIMGWVGIPLDLMTITIASIAMGIAVDDTIHYLHRYRNERDQETAIENTHASVGIAIILTSVLITLGFAMLAFSDFVPSVLFGLLTGLAMIAALLANLCLLPALLRLFPGRQGAA